MASAPLLECRNISFERDDLPLFTGVDFSVFSGEGIQVTGANGTGKTTLLRILATSLSSTEGEICWRGEEISKAIQAYRSDMLYLGHNAGIKGALTPLENLQWFFRLYPSAHTDYHLALERVKLLGYEDSPCHTLSAGQKRRVALARLYMSSASLWILDEPYTSIDVHGVKLLESLMASHLNGGGSLILTSHQKLGLEQVRVFDLESCCHV